MRIAFLIVAALFVLGGCSQAAPVPASPSEQTASVSNECLTSEAHVPAVSPTPRPFVVEDELPSPTAAPVPGVIETPTPYPTQVLTPTVTNAPQTIPMASRQSLDGSLTVIGEWTPQYPGGFFRAATGQIDGKDYALLKVGDGYRLFELRPSESPVATNGSLESPPDGNEQVIWSGDHLAIETPPGQNHKLLWSGGHLAITVDTGLERVTYFYAIEDAANFCLVGVHPGVTKVFAIENGHAFAATNDESSSYSQYALLDVTDPKNVKEIELGDPELDDVVWAAAVRDGLLYGTAWDHRSPSHLSVAKFVILDISDPENVTTIGELGGSAGDDTGIYGDEIEIAGGYAYLMVDGMAIRIINVSDPANPAEAGMLPPDRRETHTSGGIIEPAGIIVDGSRLYALSWGGDWGVYRWRLLAVDISDPANPEEIGRFEGRHFVSGMWLQGDEVAVVDPYGITVIDASDPTNLRQTNRIPSYYGSNAVHMGGPNVALFLGSGVFSLNIEDPSNPQPLDFWYNGPIQVVTRAVDSGLEESHEIFEIRISGAGGGYKLDASELPELKLREINQRVLPVNPKRGPYVYSAVCGALRVTDETDGQGQAARRERVRLADSRCGEEWDVALHDDFAYVTGLGNLYILDLSDPAAPTLLSQKSLTSELQDEYQSNIRIENGLAYILHGGLWVFDLSVPDSPREIAHYPTDAHVLDLDGSRIGLLSSNGVFTVLRFEM